MFKVFQFLEVLNILYNLGIPFILLREGCKICQLEYFGGNFQSRLTHFESNHFLWILKPSFNGVDKLKKGDKDMNKLSI